MHLINYASQRLLHVHMRQRRDGESTDVLIFHQIVDFEHHILWVHALHGAKNHLYAKASGFGCLCLTGIEQRLHKGRRRRVHDHTDSDGIARAYQRTSCAIGSISLFLCDPFDPLTDLRTHISFIIERSIYRSTRYAAQFCDFGNGNWQDNRSFSSDTITPLIVSWDFVLLL